MKKEEVERLKYRNQYLLMPSMIECPFLYRSYYVLGKYLLYAHQDLAVTSVERENVKLLLLGDLFDYKNPEKNNKDILRDLIENEFESILEVSGRYSGRYVIFYNKGDKLYLFHDPTATRKIYYYNSQNDFWIASQPHLLAKVLNFEKTNNPELLDYYGSKEFVRLHNANIGDTTLYDEIKQLMPNHFLDVTGGNLTRYWPRTKIERRSIKEGTMICAKMIEGYMESIINRYNVMLPVTAGKDSRILLAATKRFKEKVYYYINKSGKLTDTHPDISIPSRLMAKENLDFHILNPPREVDSEFKKIYFFNNEFASTEYLPIIYNYYVNFSKKVNVPGNIASAGLEGYRKGIKISGESLAHLNRVDRYSFAKNYYEKWISECKDLCLTLDFNLFELFYWEERLANWGAQIQLEKDIAQEDINLYNSRDLIVSFLSVQKKSGEAPFFKLHKRIIRLLWPELLKFPINPGWRTSMRKLFKPLGLLDIYYRLKN